MKKIFKSANTPINIDTKKLNPSEILRKKQILINIKISIILLRISKKVIIGAKKISIKMLNKFTRMRKKSK
jgi:hypothetical protein